MRQQWLGLWGRPHSLRWGESAASERPRVPAGRWSAGSRVRVPRQLPTSALCYCSGCTAHAAALCTAAGLWRGVHAPHTWRSTPPWSSSGTMSAGWLISFPARALRGWWAWEQLCLEWGEGIGAPRPLRSRIGSKTSFLSRRRLCSPRGEQQAGVRRPHPGANKVHSNSIE